jgi:hypothetical protein
MGKWGVGKWGNGQVGKWGVGTTKGIREQGNGEVGIAALSCRAGLPRFARSKLATGSQQATDEGQRTGASGAIGNCYEVLRLNY